MSILQSFAHYGVDIFNRLFALLMNTRFDGIPLAVFLIVGFAITVMGMVWGFDFD